MNRTDLINEIKYLNSLEDSEQYRKEWNLGTDVGEFSDNVNDRATSTVDAYAQEHGISFDDALTIAHS